MKRPKNTQYKKKITFFIPNFLLGGAENVFINLDKCQSSLVSIMKSASDKTLMFFSVIFSEYEVILQFGFVFICIFI